MGTQHGVQSMPMHSRKTILLATDQQRSVLNALDAGRSHAIAYSSYGYRPRENGLLSLLGFNGEQPDPLTGHYHLGNGYRQFNPVLMRFNSPDSWSPFGEGGLNAYAYCGGEPVNRDDRTGHMFKVPIKTAPAKGSLTNGAAPPKKALPQIAEVIKPSTTKESTNVFTTHSAAPEIAKGTRQVKHPPTLSSTTDIEFRNSLHQATEGGNAINLATSNSGTLLTPTTVSTVRPQRSRNKFVLGGDKDFVNLKIAASKPDEPSIQNKQVRYA